MENTTKTKSIIYVSPSFFWFLTVSYSMVIAISNWFDARLVEIFSVVISPGTLIFPLSFLLSDIITEVYGYKQARRAIWAALFFNVIFLLYGQLIVHLPSPSFATHNIDFDKLLSLNFYIILGSFLSYLVSEPINSYIIAKLKILMQGKYMGIRFLLSTIIASGIDSTLFTLIAFSHTIELKQLGSLIFNIWIIKTIIEVLGIPISIRFAKFLKNKEGIDIYDYNTKFGLFTLNASYPADNNKFFLRNEHE